MKNTITISARTILHCLAIYTVGIGLFSIIDQDMAWFCFGGATYVMLLAVYLMKQEPEDDHTSR